MLLIVLLHVLLSMLLNVLLNVLVVWGMKVAWLRMGTVPRRVWSESVGRIPNRYRILREQAAHILSMYALGQQSGSHGYEDVMLHRCRMLD